MRFYNGESQRGSKVFFFESSRQRFYQRKGTESKFGGLDFSWETVLMACSRGSKLAISPGYDHSPQV